MDATLRVLHTSDWHLGATLFRKKRTEEQKCFLDWLVGYIKSAQIDILLIAGDIFDTTTPGTRAQELYYHFLFQVQNLCKHVVLIAGNHDSPAFLRAPKPLLKAFNIHVSTDGGEAEEDCEEVLPLLDKERPLAVVAAVPYLRDRDLRLAEAGESEKTKEEKMLQGLTNHYAQVLARAEETRKKLGADVPLIAMGHLFTQGGQTIDGDGVRELYVGNLAHVSHDIFPNFVDYVALGHLHVPQIVGGKENIRYSGSPIPMGFNEAAQAKQLCLIEFQGTTPQIQTIAVPCFQRMVHLCGSREFIEGEIAQCVASQEKCWVDIDYEGIDANYDVQQAIEKSIQGSQVEVVKIINKTLMKERTEAVKATKIIKAVEEVKKDKNVTELNELTEEDVFKCLLSVREVPKEQREALLQTFHEALSSLKEQIPEEDASLQVEG